jgi:hypothetical protein
MFKPLLPLVLCLAAQSASAGEFRALSLPGSQLVAMSADGRSAAGGVIGGGSGGFRWHEGEPARLLEHAVSVRAISASGRYVAGSSLDAQQREVATWWDADGNSHALGGLPGTDASAGLLSAAYGVTDQPQVVGVGANGADTVAFSWTAEHGLQALDADGASSAAIGISDDGRHIFGWSAPSNATRRGVVWSDGRACCHSSTRAHSEEFVGGNRAGTILLGVAGDDAHAQTPYRWSAEARGASAITATAAVKFTASSDDGDLLAGAAGSGGQRVAVVWTPTDGVVRLQDFLAARAIAIPTDWVLLAATAVSNDGRRLGGFGLRDGRFDSFIVDLSSPADAASRLPTAP